MNFLDVHPVPCLKDNYAYLVVDRASKVTACVDPSEVDPVLEALDRHKLKLHFILNTHHHTDHVGGNIDLMTRTKCKIIGFRGDARRIPGIDELLEDQAICNLGVSQFQALHIPGHTKGALAYYFAEGKAVFTGDTLFSLGCGRLFEGTPEEMWSSLLRLKRLPSDTRLYCGHEYTEANGAFALTLDPDNKHLIEHLEVVHSLRQKGKPSLPSVLALEKFANPFLRCDDLDFKKKIGFQKALPEEVFAHIRSLKDHF